MKKSLFVGFLSLSILSCFFTISCGEKDNFLRYFSSKLDLGTYENINGQNSCYYHFSYAYSKEHKELILKAEGTKGGYDYSTKDNFEVEYFFSFSFPYGNMPAGRMWCSTSTVYRIYKENNNRHGYEYKNIDYQINNNVFGAHEVSIDGAEYRDIVGSGEAFNIVYGDIGYYLWLNFCKKLDEHGISPKDVAIGNI